MASFEVEPAEKPLIGHARVPGDKSIGHRAVMLGALCEGEVVISGLSVGADNRSTCAAMAALGAEVTDEGGVVRIKGRGLRGLVEPEAEIDCGNAGTLMRLISGIAAGQPFTTRLVGDESLTERPMRRVADPLAAMGAEVSGLQRDGNIYPPLEIFGGALHGIDYSSPVASAQVKSAVLLAALFAEGSTTVREPGSSRDHTERMLRYLGVPLEFPEPRMVRLDPAAWSGRFESRNLVVPADPSSSAFVVAAALVAGVDRVSVPETCVNPTRTGFLDVLNAMNARVELETRCERAGEPNASLIVTRGAGDDLKAATVSGDLIVRAIDEVPILAVVSAFADGVTTFEDAGELRVKESDRIATTCEMLRSFGVEVEERDEGFSVAGVPGRHMRAARINSHGDHRIAMAGAVAALAADGTSRIDSVDNVATSFPGFAEVMGGIGAMLRLLG